MSKKGVEAGASIHNSKYFVKLAGWNWNSRNQSGAGRIRASQASSLRARKAKGLVPSI